jgi:D-alanyl-D-alanine carboxypeptidase (penicillin-binding protein 5/6)
MHVIAPARYQPKPAKKPKRPYIIIPLVCLLLAATVNVLRPVPTPKATLTLATPAAATTTSLPWPASGQAAIAADGYGLLGTSGNSQPLATASIAKVITALCVLQKQPLKPGASGPSYTVTDDDVARYDAQSEQGGSLLPVVQGEKITEYQALEALMLPSANNIADSLAVWVFGSQSNYAAYATDFLQQHDLNSTHIGPDASGFNPNTTSTASDLTSLGLLALHNPVLMEIAGKSETTLPVAGTVSNYDTILGQNGITGLKTGNNDADPGAFLFTATAQIGGTTIPLTGSVMGAADLGSALRQSSQLAANMRANFEPVVLASAGQAVGRLTAVWGAHATIVTASEVRLVRWKGTPLSVHHQLNARVRSGVIGSLKASAGQPEAAAQLRLAQPLAGPSFWWRLTRH